MPASPRRAGPEPPASQRPSPRCLPDRGRKDRPWPRSVVPATLGLGPCVQQGCAEPVAGRVTKAPTAGHAPPRGQGAARRWEVAELALEEQQAFAVPAAPRGGAAERGGEPVTGACGRGAGRAQAG